MPNRFHYQGSLFFLLIFLVMIAAVSFAQAGGAPGQLEGEQTFIIRDHSKNLLKIEQLIKSLDVAPRQVLIEAHIFDVALDNTNSMGMDWGAIMTQLGKSEPLWQFNQTLAQSGGAGTLRFGTLSNEHFSLLLNGLRNNRRARSLSNPKIMALSGRKASISVEQKIVYTTTNTTYSQAGTAQTNEEVKSESVPIRLEVVPLVYEDGTMRMQVTPEISAVTSYIQNGAPNIETRRADAEIIMNDGETLILGGLITENRSTEKDQVPLFGKIPLLKKMFSRTNKISKRSELVVFITPNIVGTHRAGTSKFKRKNQIEEVSQKFWSESKPGSDGHEG